MATTEPDPLDKKVIVGAALMAGAANVIMQLARPGVGHGVIESKVESGQLHRHPIKRSRTTFGYLAVALLGSPEEKAAYRKAVNRSHARVRSGPSSPVRYNAFDSGLQLWVAACLYRGFEDTYRAFVGPLAPADQERLYKAAATLGTTLQVPPEAWPADREAFEDYWREEMKQVSIDEPVREYLLEIADLRFLPRPISMAFGGSTGSSRPGSCPRTSARRCVFPGASGTSGGSTGSSPPSGRWCACSLRRSGDSPSTCCCGTYAGCIRTGRPLV